MTTAPLVDIAIVTYNHEKFIAQAIESVLVQQTIFHYRLIIGDDCSEDHTQDIVRDYAERCPERIKTILYSEHLGIYHEDRVSLSVLKECTAKYVALLDGDDYWTNSRKLQKQVNWLETHPDFAVCAHNVLIKGEGELKDFNEPYHVEGIPETLTIEDLIAGVKLPTNSLLFRADYICRKPIPQWMVKVRHGDKWFYTNAARFGKVHYDPTIMGVYRKHSGGMVGSYRSWSRHQLSDVVANDVFFWRNMWREVGSCDEQFRGRIALASTEAVSTALRANLYHRGIRYSWVFLRHCDGNYSRLAIVWRIHISQRWDSMKLKVFFLCRSAWLTSRRYGSRVKGFVRF